jgi:hypothetical protein
MKIRLALLLISTLDAWALGFIRWAQAQAIDTSVLIALIAGLVGLATLLIQTYGQIQLARIKDRQEAQAHVVEKQSDKIDKQSAQIAEVHTTVNSGRDKMIEELKLLTDKVGRLEGAAIERDKSDAKAANFESGKAAAGSVAPASPETKPSQKGTE